MESELMKVYHSKLNTNLILQELKEVTGSLEFATQYCLQGVKGDDSPLYGAREGKYLEHDETEFTEFLFPQLNYTNTLLDAFGMTRSRVMKIGPKSTLSYHRDPSWRLHIPLVTHDHCFMLLEDRTYHMEVGNHYKVDTRVMHSFINLSKNVERIHIIGCI